MKQAIFIFLASTSISLSAFAQGTDGVLIDPNNATTRDASAVFQAQSTSQGILVPRMTAAQRSAIPVSAARDGLMVYQTDAPAGFYYYNGAALAWVLIANTTGNLAGVTAGTGLTGGGTSGTISVNAVGDNGLTTNADDIDLGGPLTQAATTITQDGSETFTIANTGTGNTTINLTSTGDFDVIDNGASALFVRDDAFVGVGTNAPNSPFTVRTTVATANARTSSLANAVGDILFELTTSKGATTNAVGDITTQIGQSYNGGTITEGIRFFRGVGASDGAMAFITNSGSERMRINSAGLVGINTNNPLASLHVKNGKAFINKSNVDPQTVNYANADLVLGDNTTSRSGYTGGTGSHLFLQSSDKSTITALDESNNLGQIAYQNLVWTIGEDIGWGTQVIKAPNLAGTGSRVVVADATGNLSATTSIGTGIVSGSGTQNYVTKWNNAAGTTIGNSLIYDNGTNVGIGSATPGGKLDLNGGPLTLSNAYIDINRDAFAKNGISWYSQTYPSWSDYMAQAAQTSVGPHGDLTAPSGIYVTSWAKRDYIENAGGYGWTFESAANTTTPAVKFEIRASDGLFHSYGTGIIDGNLTVGGAVTSIGGYSPANSAIRLTPNLHLNATQNNAVILNWDNGATGTGTQMLRIGNGAGADMFGVLANGDVTIQNKVALRGNDSWLRLNQDAGFASGTYTPGFFRADGGIASGGLGAAAGVVNAATGYQINTTAAAGNYLRGNGTNFVSSAIQLGDLPAHTHTWAQVTAKPAAWLDGSNLIADNGNFNNSVPSGFYQSSGATNAPGGSWYNMINVRHSNTANDHGFQIAASYYDEKIWTRTYQGGTGANNGTFTPWAELLSSRSVSNTNWTLAQHGQYSDDDIGFGWTAATDDSYFSANMGFNIMINGTNYADLTLNTNGTIVFGSQSTYLGYGGTLPNGGTALPILAWYWRDMVTRYRYGSVGTAPNRVYIIDFDSNAYNTGDDVDGQIQIHETSGLINVFYRVMDPAVNGQNGVIGFQLSGGSSAKTYPITGYGKAFDDNRLPQSWSVSPVR